MSQLPDSWGTASLANLSLKVGSGATPRGGEAAYKQAGTPLIRSMNVVMFGFKRDGLAYLDANQAEALQGATVRAGDVLLNITGASIGRVTIAPQDMDGARVNQHVCIIRPVRHLDARFLRAYLSSPAMQAEIRGEHYGVTRPALTKQQILEFPIPLAPMEEQSRLADMLDALLARVQTCRERLDRVPSILKKFRKAVLEAAVSGRLTDEWRHENTSPSWRDSTVGSVLREIRYGTAVKCAYDFALGTPVLRIPNVTSGRIDTTDLKYGKIGKAEISKLVLEAGDLLVVRSNGSVELVGRVSWVPPGFEAYAYAGYLMRLRVEHSLVNSRYLAIVLNGPAVRACIELTARSMSGVHNINADEIRAMSLPLPSLDEQSEIVRRVDDLFAMADELERRYRAAVAKAEKLMPAVLTKAFRGELVSQDASDVSASALLETILTQRLSDIGLGRRCRQQ